jgi:enamine deaminase RidA (YjgF/YER057c/UK114 family)
MSSVQSESRRVAGVVDNETMYAASAAAGGGLAFVAGTAIDETGEIAEGARPEAPYANSPAARARLESRYIWERWRKALPEVGSSIGDVVQVEQYVQRKAHADGYFAEALSSDLLGTGTANGATAQVGEFYPAGAAISLNATAVVPETGAVKSFPGQEGSPTGKFADPVAGGSYLFTTVFPMDRAANGVPTEVRQPDWSWNDSEIRSEAQWGVAQLQRRLESLGGSVADVVDYTVLLTDLADLYEFDLVMRSAFGDAPPARTVIHMRGNALPRRVGALGHGEGAARMEIQYRCVLPGSGAERAEVVGDRPALGYQATAVSVGRHVWLSSQLPTGDALEADIDGQLADVFERLQATCARAGTSVGQLLRARVQLRNADHVRSFFAALRAAVPENPPVVSVLVVDALPIEGALVAVDGVALLPT